MDPFPREWCVPGILWLPGWGWSQAEISQISPQAKGFSVEDLYNPVEVAGEGSLPGVKLPGVLPMWREEGTSH